MNNASLSGKTALVTGGSRGIGRSICFALAAHGARVALTYNMQQKVACEVVAEIISQGGEACALQYDAARPAPETQQTLVCAVQRRFGGIDMLINNAAMVQEQPFTLLTAEDWHTMLQVNLVAPALLAQAVLPEMQRRGWGRIVSIASIGGQWGGTRQVHYAAGKAGLLNLTKSLAKLYAREGITVNAVAPGLVGTAMVARELASTEGQAKVAAIPLGRIATPKEVASAVTWLCSDEARYVTGQCLNVNGGMYMP